MPRPLCKLTEMDDGWEKPASVPSPPWRRRKWLLAAAMVVCAGLAVMLLVMGFLRTRSLDVPLPRNIHLGFFLNSWPVRWTCPDGHDHWSMPFWSGALGMSVVTLLVARWFARA